MLLFWVKNSPCSVNFSDITITLFSLQNIIIIDIIISTMLTSLLTVRSASQQADRQIGRQGKSGII